MGIKRGFTLAEVLITLVVIGIIAAITIPSLINKTNEQETVVGVKKAYSILSQAVNMAKTENGDLNTWFADNDNNKVGFVNKLKSYLSVVKYCRNSQDCLHPDSKYLDGTSFLNYWKNRPTLVLQDGSIAVFYFGDSKCDTAYGLSEPYTRVCGDLVIDVNGQKNPNTIGMDMFHFLITKYGIFPSGDASIFEASNYSFDTCNTDDSGFGCTSWVLNKGNMDYLSKGVD